MGSGEPAGLTAIYVEMQGWFSAARLPRHLAAAGFRVIGIFAGESPASCSRALAERHFIDQAALGPLLASLIGRCPEALILPADETALQSLHPLLLADGAPEAVRAALRRSLGPPSGRAVAASKRQTVELAARLGIPVPRQITVDGAAAARAFALEEGYPIVLKLENTSGGSGVRICRDATDIDVACVELVKTHRLARAMRKLCVLAGRRFPPLLRLAAGLLGGSGLIAQEFIPGKPAFTTFAAWEGKVLAELAAVVEQVLPRWFGLSSVAHFTSHREMSRSSAALAEALMLSGLVGIDFMLDEASGRAYLLEINARSTPSVHLGGRLGADLCAVLAAACRGEVPEPAALAREEVVALFPNELERDPDSHWLSGDAFHDVPLAEPELLAAWRGSLPKDSPLLRRTFD